MLGIFDTKTQERKKVPSLYTPNTVVGNGGSDGLTNSKFVQTKRLGLEALHAVYTNHRSFCSKTDITPIAYQTAPLNPRLKLAINKGLGLWMSWI